MQAYNYIITYYSDVKLPNYKGLLMENLQIQMEEKPKKGNLIGFNIDANLCLAKLDNSIQWTILKSQSQFTLDLNKTLSEDDAYQMIRIALKCLKQFQFAKQNGIDGHLGRLPLYSKEEIFSDVKGLFSFFESRRNK